MTSHLVPAQDPGGNGSPRVLLPLITFKSLLRPSPLNPVQQVSSEPERGANHSLWNLCFYCNSCTTNCYETISAIFHHVPIPELHGGNSSHQLLPQSAFPVHWFSSDNVPGEWTTQWRKGFSARGTTHSPERHFEFTKTGSNTMFEGAIKNEDNRDRNISRYPACHEEVDGSRFPWTICKIIFSSSAKALRLYTSASFVISSSREKRFPIDKTTSPCQFTSLLRLLIGRIFGKLKIKGRCTSVKQHIPSQNSGHYSFFFSDLQRR